MTLMRRYFVCQGSPLTEAVAAHEREVTKAAKQATAFVKRYGGQSPMCNSSGFVNEQHIVGMTVADDSVPEGFRRAKDRAGPRVYVTPDKRSATGKQFLKEAVEYALPGNRDPLATVGLKDWEVLDDGKIAWPAFGRVADKMVVSVPESTRPDGRHRSARYEPPTGLTEITVGEYLALVDGKPQGPKTARSGEDERRAVRNLAHGVKNSKQNLPQRLRDYAQSVLRMLNEQRI